MSPVLSRELIALLSSSHTTQSQAADAIEEHIIHRRLKGDTLDDVSASLSLMEGKAPRLVPAIRQAQYVTNVPPASGSNETNLTPSSTPTAVLAYLLADPMPPIHMSRKVLLEYVLSREARLRDKKSGRGGKGTLGREGFEELANRMREIEDGLRGTGPLAHASRLPRGGPVADEDLSPARQTGLALVLSLRMLLSYFTLPDLAKQLLQQTPQDAERTLIQHVRRRVAGEGRYAVGRDLEYVETLTLNRRPALRPAFRSSRNRTQLAPRALYPITLPAPSKSACIKMLTAFVKEVEQAGPTAASAYMQTGPAGPTFPSGTDRSLRPRKTSPKPGTPGSFGSSPGSPTPGSPVKVGQAPPPTDTSPLENYTVELLSEFLMREKREYMLKNKWVKTGREQLSKDLGDIEVALCTSGKTMSPSAPALLPAFLLLRRTFALPSSPLPPRMTDQYYETLPSPPDPDSVPLREPTVSSTTAMLYVNPRLPDDIALDAIEELIENEREKGMNAAISQEKTIAWLNGLVDQVEKRFPDGSYEAVLDRARYIAAHPRVWPDASTSNSFPAPPPSPNERHGHRRTQSSAHPSISSHEEEPMPMRDRMGSMHSRSASMPMRTSMHSSKYSGSAPGSPGRQGPPSSFMPASPNGEKSPYSVLSARGPSSLPYADNIGSDDSSHYSGNSANITMDETLPEKHDLSALGFGGMSRTRDPPMLSLFVPGPELDIGIPKGSPSPSGRYFRQSTNSNGPESAISPTGGGWWDVVSAGSEASPAHHRAPWANRASSSPSSAGSLILNSPTSAPSNGIHYGTNVMPQIDLTPKMNEGTPTNTPPKPYDSPITPQLANDSPRSHGSTPKTTPNRKPVPHVKEGNTPPKPESEPRQRATGYDESDLQASYVYGDTSYGQPETLASRAETSFNQPETSVYEPSLSSSAYASAASYTHSSYNDFKPSYNTDFNPAPLQRDPVLSMDSLRANLPQRAARATESPLPHSRQPSGAHSRQVSQTHSRQASQTHSRQPSQTHSRQPSRSKAGALDLPTGTSSFDSSRYQDDNAGGKDLPPVPPMPAISGMAEPKMQPAKPEVRMPEPRMQAMPEPRMPAKPAPLPKGSPEAQAADPPAPAEAAPEPESAESAAQSAARAEALSRLMGPAKPAREPSPPPPAEPELTEEQEDLYASLDFMPSEYKSTMSKKPAGTFSHGQQQSGSGLSRSMSKQGQGLSRTMSKPQQSQPGSSHTRSASKTNVTKPPVSGESRWQRRRPSEHQTPPIDTSPPHRVDEFGVAPKSAPSMPSSSTWPNTVDETSQSADGHDMHGNGSDSLSRPGRSIPVKVERPPAHAPSSPTESKGKFNLSSMMGRPKRDKENSAAVPLQQRRPSAATNPGRWNRNMVADIMGPPVSRG